MFVRGILGVIFGTIVTTSHTAIEQIPLVGQQSDGLASSNPQPDSLRAAIIGSGIGGSVAAYNLAERLRNRMALSISVFEREASIGGRVQSQCVYPWQGGQDTMELGSAYILGSDRCMQKALKDAGLERAPPLVLGDSTCIWCDREDVSKLSCDFQSLSWTGWFALYWKYDYTVWKFRAAVLNIEKLWRFFFRANYGQNCDINGALRDTGLQELADLSASKFLQTNNINERFQNDMIKPCLHARTARDVTSINALTLLLAAASPSAVSTNTGNSRLVERLLSLSRTRLLNNSSVTHIEPGEERRFLVRTRDDSNTEEFDTVILASPLENSGIDMSRLSLSHPLTLSDPENRREKHVTHMSSTDRILPNSSPVAMNVSVLNSRFVTSQSEPLRAEERTACFKRAPCDFLGGSDCDSCDDDDKLYRIESTHYLTDSDLVKLIGQEYDEDRELSDYGIVLIQRDSWIDSCPPINDTSARLPSIKLAEDLYYLNAAEWVGCSMEMSCRAAEEAALSISWEHGNV